MDWMHVALMGLSAVTMLGGYAAAALKQRQAQGQPKIIDPHNQRPLIDLIRDAVSQGIQTAFVPKDDPAPVPVAVPLPAPTAPVDLNALVAELTAVVKHAMTQLAQVQPATPASTVLVPLPPK